VFIYYNMLTVSPLPTPPAHDPRPLLQRRSPKANSFQKYDKHQAAHAAGRDWIQARFGTRAEWQVPWKDVSMHEMQELADQMAQAAGVPLAKRREISREMCAWLGIDYTKRKCIRR
jgi:hypothetical protein